MEYPLYLTAETFGINKFQLCILFVTLCVKKTVINNRSYEMKSFS